MPKIAITPAFLRALKPPAVGQVEHADATCPGLRLRVSHGGAATWLLGCRDALGKPRRFTLGAYPAIGLAAARDLARTRREEVRGGADPIREAAEARRVAAQPAPVVASLTALLDAYGRDVGDRRRSWGEARRRIEDVFQAHLTRATIEITAPELQLTVDAHKSRSSAGAAVRYVRPVLKWGSKRGLITRGTGETLDQPDGALAVRQRRLTRDEMHAILAALGNGNYGRATRWLLLTGCRLNEACDMRWQDVDMTTGIWTLAANKQDRPHAVPLPRQAMSLLRGLLPVDEGEAKDPEPAALVFPSKRGGKLANWDRATKAVQEASGTSGWHRHDIRRSVASLMGDLGLPPHVIEVALGHALKTSSDGSALSRVATVYNTSRYVREHADALQQLADELDRIEADEANVVRLVRA